MADVLAVDIALLLPEPARRRAEALNRTLWLARPETLRFDETHVPHVTLVQQFVRAADLAALEARIDTVVAGRGPLALRVTGFDSSGDALVWLVEPTPALQQLHEDLMDACATLEAAEGDAEAFWGPGEPPRPRDVAWVRRFRQDAAYGRFVPHITLGYGDPPAATEPFAFATDRLALCHLGRFCTCRRILREWTLLAES